MSESDAKARDSRLRWLMAIAIGTALFSNLADSASRTVSEIAGLPLWAVLLHIVLGALSFGGIMAGIAIIQMYPWGDFERVSGRTIARLAAGTGGGVAGMVTLAALADAGDPAGAVIPAVGAGIAAYAGIEWFMLRGREARAGAIGLLGLAALAGAALATALGDRALPGFAASSLGGALFGAVYAAVTSISLRDGGGQQGSQRES